MTDEGTAAPGATGAEDKPLPEIKMLAHFIRDLSFENAGAADPTPATGAPEITVVVNLEGNAIGDERYQVAIKLKGTAKSAEKTRFIVELDYVGIFTIQNVPQTHLHPVIFIECPRQLLPFARRVVADVTRDGGYPPLMLDNIDFSGLYRQKLAELQNKQANGDAQATGNGETAQA
ncbi:MAG: protein-export chaperone SecB [Pseudomonadota bacterium]